MKLYIAEKPALALDIANALTDGKPSKKNGYFECGEDKVTWCIGHLLKSVDPEAYNPSYKQWKQDDLPLNLFPLQYEVIPDKADHTRNVINLIKEADEIVHGGDPDDEGQLLVDELILFAGYTKTVKRVLISDNTPNAVKKSLANLKDNSDFFGIYQKTYARTAGDLLYGLSMSRAYTIAAQAKGYQGVLSVGRVQTPILGLIVRRWLANQAHTSSFFYTLDGTFTVGGNTFTARLKPSEDLLKDDKGRVIDKAAIDRVGDRCKGQAATVRDCAVKEKQTTPPLPFNLIKLQQHMNKRFGLTAAQTLEITQALREKYKAITYNRSDCNYLSDEQFADAPNILAALKEKPEFMHVATEPGIKSKAFDDSKISAHTAIIPTINVPDISALSDLEAKVYQAIARQYLVQFMRNKKYLEASGSVDVAGEVFSYKTMTTVDPGFETLLKGSSSENKEENDESSDDEVGTAFESVSELKAGDSGSCRETSVTEKKTTPPALFTEATLLAALVRIADFVSDPVIKKLLKDKDRDNEAEHGGIGTSATRSAIIETLKTRNFITLDKSKIIPTETGIAFFNALPDIATQPDMTALWSEQQTLIEQGSLSVDDFISKLMTFLTEQVSQVDVGEIKGEHKPREGGLPRLESPCPNCGKEIVASAKTYACTGCTFKVWATIADKKITASQVETLIKKGKTVEIKGFVSKKTGKSFSAMLVLQDKTTGAVSFEFAKKK
ncbi:type IA DNA topoisomerase [Pseudomonas amygdali]|uniref:type IA DNA topoisomerase n=1 Tax=Pseudomonas amygdali TaxID=47877 RepID=UPI000760934B|nr:type IA DNA topoisomerase [Pseudomonas amygdali]KWS54905.1 DNA topoisomerase III [Pseudomonas amygdali pv. morsprunorum]POD00964.1 DNA topoisomerase III [Pseudomonas avellanae]